MADNVLNLAIYAVHCHALENHKIQNKKCERERAREKKTSSVKQFIQLQCIVRDFDFVHIHATQY